MRTFKYKSCILLTACVNPKGMSHTLLQDPGIRATQYKNALDFYIKSTELPVVFCENTMYDMKSDYEEYIKSGRLEYLTFDGNNYDKGRGKGYGEALIMRYAVEHSELIKKSKYVIKITGRIVVADIKRISSSRLLYLDNVYRSNIKNKFISTYLFIARPQMLLHFLSKYQEQIWEDSPTNDLIEHHWYRALTKDPEFINTLYLPFFRIPHIIGISGTTGDHYSMDDRLIGNLVYTYFCEIERGNKLRAIPYIIGYYIHLYIDKLKVKLGIKQKSYF